MSKFSNLITVTADCSSNSKNEYEKPSNPTKKTRKYQSYVTGQIPIPWVCEACQFGGKEAKLAWVCWFLYGVEKKQPFKISNIYAKRFGLSREAKREAIKKLEFEGLISVERLQSSSPIITIIIRDDDYMKIFSDI